MKLAWKAGYLQNTVVYGRTFQLKTSMTTPLYTFLFAVHESTPNPGIFGAPLTSRGYNVLPDMTTHWLCILYSLQCMSRHPTLVSLGLRWHRKDMVRHDNSLTLYTLLFAVHEPTPNPGIFGTLLTSQGYCQTSQLIDFVYFTFCSAWVDTRVSTGGQREGVFWTP